MFSESNERLIKRRPECGKVPHHPPFNHAQDVQAVAEPTEKLRSDVEAQHAGPLPHERRDSSDDCLASSPAGQFCDRLAGVLMANSRSVTFVMALINSMIQILIYSFSLSTIINNYDPELYKNNYPQYVMHHLGYFNYMIFHCLFTGVMSWATLHLVLYVVGTLGQLVLGLPQCPSWLRNWAKGAERYSIGLYVTVALLAVVEIILLALYVLECRLLVDMSVHLIDLDLVEILGIKQVLQRQRELGAGLDPEHWPYIKLVVVLLFLGQAACFFLARLILRKMTRPKLRKLFLGIILVITVSGLLVMFQTAFIYEDVEHYRGQLPFNYFDPNPVDKLIPTLARTNAVFPPTPGSGYPLASEELQAAVRLKKNVILLSVESMRHDDATHVRSPHLMKFVEDHKCIAPQRHAGAGHVSEMGQFGMFYGLHSYHYHTFSVGHIPSYALKLLKQNGYVTGGVVATAAWNYPNRNLYNNFDEFDSMNDNYEFLEKTQAFVERRKEDKKPFFLFLHVHKRPLPDPLPAGYYQRDAENDQREFSNRIIRFKDEDRHRALEILREAGMLEGQSIVVLTSDHGNMEGEHGERGHGQRESSWWNEKALLPAFICIPGEDMEQYQRPALGSHVDIIPTFMDYLGLSPKIDSRVYSNGRSLLIKKDEPDWTVDRFVVFSPRYFPEKNKVIAVATTDYKFWFRVASFDHKTRSMDFVPLKATRWDDESLCMPYELREEWSRIPRSAGDREVAVETKCKLGHFSKLAERFRHEFFNFLDVDYEAYA